MLVLDTTFLVDYLNADQAAAAFLDEHNGKPLFTPSLALFEVYRGAARTIGHEGIDRVTDALDWVEPLEFTGDVAREAAIIEAELYLDGNPINLGDVLIAAVCRYNGGQLVTRIDDFEHVDALETLSY